MTVRNIYIAFLLSLFCISKAFAQVNIDFIPAISGATIDGLINVRITNLGPRKIIRLDITVSQQYEESTVQVVHILTQPFDVNTGTNMVPPSAVRSAKVEVGNNPTARFLQQNGYFPSGQYSYDFKILLVATQEVLIEQTFIHDLEPAAPLNLIEPYDRDSICETKPLLSWQPHIPMVAGTQYQVVLAEIGDKQNGTEALQYNLPIVNQRSVPANMLMFPATARGLLSGKRYAWQVTAYKDGIVLNRSEVWEFVVKCQDTMAVAAPELSYRTIEDLAKGNFYMAQGRLSFVLVNSYAEQPLQYGITCLTNPKIRVARLPEKKLLRGRNKIDIDLANNKAFKQDYSYMLTVVMPNGQLKNLRFIYKE
jgi:hypothetical protein